MYSPNIFGFFFNLKTTAVVVAGDKQVEMTKVSEEIITVLRSTAEQLMASPDYQWGHMGACNCGFLAQEVTRLSKGEIHKRAMQGYGDWNEQLNDYCPTSGLLFDDVITALLSAGFDVDDLKNLETLSSPEVLGRLNGLHLLQNRKEDVALYLNTWADVLENDLFASSALSPVESTVMDESLYLQENRYFVST